MTRLFLKAFIVAGMSVGFGAHGQEAIRPAEADQRSQSPLVKRLKREAGRVNSTELSPMFTALFEPKTLSPYPLSDQERDFAVRLIAVTRDIVKAWLLAGIESDPPPPSAVLVERLSEPGYRLRARVVGHAEAILLEGVLRPEKARLLLRATGRKPQPLLPDRYPASSLRSEDDTSPASTLAERLRDKASSYYRSGGVMFLLLGRPGTRKEYPNGLERLQLNQIQRENMSREMPAVKLADDEFELGERLDALEIAIIRAWLTRDLDRIPLPPQRILAQRAWEGGERIVASVERHTEAIALDGIATPEQATRVLAAFWISRGVNAFLDPAFATSLRLSRAQKDEIIFLIESKRAGAQAIMLDAINDGPGTQFYRSQPPEVQQKLTQEFYDRLRQVDNTIWDILTPSQARALRRMRAIAKPPAQAPAAMDKRSARSN